jgi:glycosyltransferase involved in cell wall biosynthesis
MSAPAVFVDARDAAEPRLRGWGRYARELVAALARLDRPGFDVEPIEHGGPGPEVLFEQWRLPRLLRREGAALVHNPNCFLPLRRPCPGVVTVHDLAFEDDPGDFARLTALKYRAFVPRSVRSAERVICDSTFTRDDLCGRYGADPEKVRVIPLAPSLPSGQEKPPQGPYVLGIGDLRRKKNFARLVEAWLTLRHEGLPHRLVIAGLDAGEGPRLRELAGAEPLELAGYVTDGQLDALLRGAALLVHPSLYEGFGLVLVEAMVRGCPVAAARATALPETADQAAAYFDPLDPGNIAAVIRSAVEDRQLRKRLIAAGRERAQQLSWDRTAQETADVYRELLP